MRGPWKAWWLLPALGYTTLGCTPLGVWVYEDPRVTMSRVRVPDVAGEAPLMVVLNLHNPNDYTVSTTRLELRLSLDDLPIGRLDRDSSVSLPKGTETVIFPLVTDGAASPARRRALSTGSHRYLIVGRATLTTPLGKRKVRFAEEGALAFGPPPPTPATDFAPDPPAR